MVSVDTDLVVVGGQYSCSLGGCGKKESSSLLRLTCTNGICEWSKIIKELKGSVQSRNFDDIISRLDITEFAGAFSGAFAIAF